MPDELISVLQAEVIFSLGGRSNSSFHPSSAELDSFLIVYPATKPLPQSSLFSKTAVGAPVSALAGAANARPARAAIPIPPAAIRPPRILLNRFENRIFLAP